MNVRGHHLVCVYCFHGSGQSTARDFFGVDNAIPQLLAALQRDPDLRLTVTDDVDDVCRLCPIRQPDGCGRSPDAAAQSEKLRAWDRVILQRLGLSPGDTITARDLEDRLRRHIADIGAICTNCTSASPSGWQEFARAIRDGLWPAPPITS
jgi:hypothetical protein